ncbi:hypothetical protein JW766_02555 [Candidatus Dojkabacteria bacterium]|nr:hypothetical protein [Candidatus Dojkabacteria bacterium]
MAKEKEQQKSFIETKIGYIAAILVSILSIVFANNVLIWDIKLFDFILEDFEKCLWILNISFLATIISNMVYILFDHKIFKGVIQIVLNIISVAVILSFIRVFPFDFSKLINLSFINTCVKIAFYLGLFGTIIAIIVEAVKIIIYIINDILSLQ